MKIATRWIGPVAFTLVLGIAGSAQADLRLAGTTIPDTFTPGSQDMTANIVATQFFIATATITDLRFWSYEGLPPDAFTGTLFWSIYSDNAGAIGPVVASGLSSNVSHVEVATGEYLNDVPLSVGLGAGRYWLGLHNGPLSVDSDHHMFWAKSMQDNAYAFPQIYNLSLDGPWGSVSTPDPSYELFGQLGVSTPEPSTMFLGAFGALLWLGYACHRRRVA